MKALDRKLLRDLWHMRGQALAIISIIASGLALFTAQLSTLESLKQTRDDYYASYRFADVFVSCKRAPNSLIARIRDIDSVDAVQARVTINVTLDIPTLEEPASGKLSSIANDERARLNDLFLRNGRLPLAGEEGEIAVVEAFAMANGYRIGDTLSAIINGRRKDLRIVGVVLSPEYVYSLPPGNMVPDDRRYAVMWMNRPELAAAYNMEGAFNDLLLTLAPGASVKEVIERVDDLLKPYGGLGAYPKKEQVSNWFLQNEFKQLETFGILIPIIFLGVAAFLLNVVIARLIQTQREQVAALKAFGYSNLQIAGHYGKLVALIVVLGGALGTAIGAWLGTMLIGLYQDYFHFPALHFEMPASVPLAGFAVTASAASIGTVNAVRGASSLPPAEAMRPEAPPMYRATLIERLGVQRWLAQPSRMILRQLERRPVKALASIVAMSFAVAILVMGMAFMDIMYYLIDLQSNVLHREDIEVTFLEPRARTALHEIEAMPGVLHVEPYRTVPARLRFGHLERRIAIKGIPSNARLEQLLDVDLKPFKLPEEGLLISRVLAEKLHVKRGDEITVEVMEGSRPTRLVTVNGLIDDFMGLGAYMEISALNRLMREGDVISGVKLTTENRPTKTLYSTLRARPVVGAIASKETAINNLKNLIEENLMISITVNVLFAAIIAFGIIYNNARISLSERAHELASLRVLGLTRGEISYILLGELAILTLFALPIGFALGRWMTAATLQNLNSEVMRFPLVVSGATFALAASAVIVAATVSGLLVRDRLDKLDLVQVLKTRE